MKINWKFYHFTDYELLEENLNAISSQGYKVRFVCGFFQIFTRTKQAHLYRVQPQSCNHRAAVMGPLSIVDDDLSSDRLHKNDFETAFVRYNRRIFVIALLLTFFSLLSITRKINFISTYSVITNGLGQFRIFTVPHIAAYGILLSLVWANFIHNFLRNQAYIKERKTFLVDNLYVLVCLAVLAMTAYVDFRYLLIILTLYIFYYALFVQLGLSRSSDSSRLSVLVYACIVGLVIGFFIVQDENVTFAHYRFSSETPSYIESSSSRWIESGVWISETFNCEYLVIHDSPLSSTLQHKMQAVWFPDTRERCMTDEYGYTLCHRNNTYIGFSQKRNPKGFEQIVLNVLYYETQRTFSFDVGTIK